MKQCTLVKITVYDNSVSLKTISRDFRSKQHFVILRQELEDLKEHRRVIVSDIHSFAVLRLEKTVDGTEWVEITFSWLDNDIYCDLSGHKETVRLPYDRLMACLEKSRDSGGQCFRLLSVPADRHPQIIFNSWSHLKDVAANKLLRRKFGRFLAQNFQWGRTESIHISDDFLPYSFFFMEKHAQGQGLCGGIILHGQDDLKKSYYQIHT